MSGVRDPSSSSPVAAAHPDSLHLHSDLHLHLDELRPIEVRHADRPVSTAVWHDDTTGARHPVVVKCFTGADAAARAAALHRTGLALWASTAGVGRPTPAVPRPVAVGPWDDGAAVVMEALTGAAIGARGDLGRSVELAAESARLFADLHTARPMSAAGADWSGIPRRPADRVVRSSVRKLTELADVTPDVAAAAEGLVSRMRWWAVEIDRRGERLVPTHGDAAPRNVLATPDGLRLIDLDRVHLAGAGRDVAYWIAWSHATVWTGRPGQEATDDFLVHYLARRSAIARLDGAAPHRAAPGEFGLDLPFHLAAAFVRIVHGWSALRADPTGQRRVLERATALVDEAAGRAERARNSATGPRPTLDPLGADPCRCGGPRAGANMPACGHQGEDEVERQAGTRDRTGR